MTDGCEKTRVLTFRYLVQGEHRDGQPSQTD